MKKGKLYLIPNLLGDSDLSQLNPQLKILLPQLKFYAVENLKIARRFLKKVDKQINIDELTFFEINEDQSIETQIEFLNNAVIGNDIGLLSDAGMPAIADPGESLILFAHQYRIQVVPLVGPNSMLLALMASGLNGEQFTFHGYLPIPQNERNKKLKQLEQQSLQQQAAQIFMETPYRNNQMLASILKSCKADTYLCIASNITLPSEKILTMPISQWKKGKYDFHKQPAVFIIQA